MPPQDTHTHKLVTLRPRGPLAQSRLCDAAAAEASFSEAADIKGGGAGGTGPAAPGLCWGLNPPACREFVLTVTQSFVICSPGDKPRQVTLEGLSLHDRFRPLSLQGLSPSKAGLPLLSRVATATVPAEINTLRKYPGQSCGPWPVEPSLSVFVSRSVYITYYVLQFQ